MFWSAGLKSILVGLKFYTKICRLGLEQDRSDGWTDFEDLRCNAQ